MNHLPHDFPPIAVNVALNMHVLAYALLLTIFTGIAFGLAPALRSSRLDLNSSMKGDGTPSGSGKRGGRFLLNTFVGSQVAVCMVLLLVAGLLLRGLYYAQAADPGFEITSVATTFLDLGTQGYDQPRATQFMMRFRERLRGLPGVMEVGQAESAPLSHDFSVDHFTVPGHADKVAIEYNHVSPNYFSLIGIPLCAAEALLLKKSMTRLGSSSQNRPPAGSGQTKIRWVKRCTSPQGANMR